MVAAAAQCAANPIEFGDFEGEYDEERGSQLAATFTRDFIQYCRGNPGASGAAAASVQLVHAMVMMFDEMEGEEEDDESGFGYDDDIGYDDEDWRP